MTHKPVFDGIAKRPEATASTSPAPAAGIAAPEQAKVVYHFGPQTMRSI